MQVADRRRQHDDITWRQPAVQDQLPHKEDNRLTLSSLRKSFSRHERGHLLDPGGLFPSTGSTQLLLAPQCAWRGGQWPWSEAGAWTRIRLLSLAHRLDATNGFGAEPGLGFCLPVGSFLVAIVYRCFDLFRCASLAKAGGLGFSPRTAAILLFHAEPQLLQNAPLDLVHGGTGCHGHAGPGVHISRAGSDGWMTFAFVMLNS